MIDIAKTRKAVDRWVHRDVVYELCDEVDRITVLHGKAHNARVAAENLSASYWREVQQLTKEVTKKEEQIQALLDALVGVSKRK